MKIGGKEYTAPNEVIVSIPRGHDPKDAITFIARALTSEKEFDERVPDPKPPMRSYPPMNIPVPVFDDPGFKAQVEEKVKLEAAFRVIKSLEATPGGIEWTTVRMEDPKTWLGWESDLERAGFSVIEIRRINHAVVVANCLSEPMVDKARDTFLRSREAAKS